MAPPESLATLPDSVQPTIFIVPWALLLIAPPSPPEVAVPAELPDRVLLWIVAWPDKLKMPPPRSLAKLPDSVQALTINVPPMLPIPPPKPWNGALGGLAELL